MILQLAWRNIWRNTRRTVITISAITFAVFAAIFTRSFQKGIWDSTIDSSVNQYFGFAQIHANGYWKEQNLNHSMPYDEQIKNLPQKVEGLKGLVPRIESYALASEGEHTAGVFVIGIDPEKENEMTGIADKMVEGRFLEGEEDGVIVAQGLAKKLGLAVSDTLVLIGQGYHGSNAAGKFLIKGIIKFPLPDLNKRLLYMSLGQAQYFYNLPDRVTTVALKIADREAVPTVVQATQNNLFPREDYEVMGWPELMPELLQAKQADEASSVITLGILYFLIAFTIFGTILMMTKERSYEFGVLNAIGMGRWKLFSVVWLETVLIGLFGALAGILLCSPIVLYFHLNPIKMISMGQETAAFEKFGFQDTLPAAFDFNVFFTQAFIIFLITCLLALYPMSKIMKLQPVSAMRS